MVKKSGKFLHKTVNPFYSALSICAALVLTLLGVATFSDKPEINNVGTVAGVNTGFNQYGYNDRARIFVGKADGIDRVLDGKVWGDPLYANDQLVMKWNAEWDRGNSENWTDSDGYDAWEDNEWNGQVAGGSGETWHYKIVWDKGCKESNTPTAKSAKGSVYCIWDQFALVMSQGTYAGEHLWDVLAVPSGYGTHK